MIQERHLPDSSSSFSRFGWRTRKVAKDILKDPSLRIDRSTDTPEKIQKKRNFGIVARGIGAILNDAFFVNYFSPKETINSRLDVRIVPNEVKDQVETEDALVLIRNAAESHTEETYKTEIYKSEPIVRRACIRKGWLRVLHDISGVKRVAKLNFRPQTYSEAEKREHISLGGGRTADDLIMTPREMAEQESLDAEFVAGMLRDHDNKESERLTPQRVAELAKYYFAIDEENKEEQWAEDPLDPSAEFSMDHVVPEPSPTKYRTVAMAHAISLFYQPAGLEAFPTPDEAAAYAAAGLIEYSIPSAF